jgi:hypothetical protein
MQEPHHLIVKHLQRNFRRICSGEIIFSTRKNYYGILALMMFSTIDNMHRLWPMLHMLPVGESSVLTAVTMK